MTEDKTILYKGRPHVFIETVPCAHRFMEEVDYDFFEQISGDAIVIPAGERPPAQLCGLHLRECLSRCPDFEQFQPFEEGGE